MHILICIWKISHYPAGPMDVIKWVASEAHSIENAASMSVLFLTACYHSTPLYSHVHRHVLKSRL